MGIGLNAGGRQMMDDVQEFSAVRLRQFREMAAEARSSAAQTADAELRSRYQQLAQAWDQLIREIESRS